MVNQPFYGGNVMGGTPMPQPNWNQPIMYPMGQMQPTQNVLQQQTPMYNQTQRSYIQGRIVNSNDDIRPNEVSADGSISVFPLADRSGILVKEITGNGTIATSSYILNTEDKKDPNTQNDEILASILKRLDDIEKAIVDQKESYSNSQKQAIYVPNHNKMKEGNKE